MCVVYDVTVTSGHLGRILIHFNPKFQKGTEVWENMVQEVNGKASIVKLMQLRVSVAFPRCDVRQQVCKFQIVFILNDLLDSFQIKSTNFTTTSV